ncbi:MAG: 16S rRNA (adenine(1518)-N(6)/adenine(1519)-N(6))-dimethyltransferase RsmA [Gemmataceae bacterium]
MDDLVSRPGLNESAPRQTLNYIRARLTEAGIQPKSKLGQNFLIDLNLIDVIVTAAELGPEDLVLEVGCGTGSLTTRLIEKAGAVLGVELDPEIFPLVSELLPSSNNLRLLHADALKSKNELNPNIFTALDELQKQFHTTRLKLVANLPYSVATPVIANLLIGNYTPERMVVTVQFEIAQRLSASLGDSEYGALSVLTGSLAKVNILRHLPPNVFWPRPQVDSAIVLIRPDPAKREHVGSPLAFRHFLRDLYTHRRKNLRGALTGWPSGRREKGDVDRLLEGLGIDGKLRAEQLDLEDHLRLSRAFTEAYP